MGPEFKAWLRKPSQKWFTLVFILLISIDTQMLSKEKEKSTQRQNNPARNNLIYLERKDNVYSLISQAYRSRRALNS